MFYLHVVPVCSACVFYYSGLINPENFRPGIKFFYLLPISCSEVQPPSFQVTLCKLPVR